MQVSRSGYYKWRASQAAEPTTPATQRRDELDAAVAAAHEASDGSRWLVERARSQNYEDADPGPGASEGRPNARLTCLRDTARLGTERAAW
jgi:hypothetical protein